MFRRLSTSQQRSYCVRTNARQKKHEANYVKGKTITIKITGASMRCTCSAESMLPLCAHMRRYTSSQQMSYTLRRVDAHAIRSIATL